MADPVDGAQSPVGPELPSQSVSKKKSGWSGPWTGAFIGVICLAAMFVLLVLPNFYGSSLSSNDTVAIANLRSICGAQSNFKRDVRYQKLNQRSYANGAKDLYQISSGSMVKCNLIDRAFSNAFGETAEQMISTDPMGKKPKAGYIYVDLSKQADGTHVDLTDPAAPITDFAYCAWPFKYGVTGDPTFVVNTEGTVYAIDNGGKPVDHFPTAEELEKNWHSCGD
jgi:hypothetical protein